MNHTLTTIALTKPTLLQVVGTCASGPFRLKYGDLLILKRIQPLEGIVWVQDVYKHFLKNQRPFN